MRNLPIVASKDSLVSCCQFSSPTEWSFYGLGKLGQKRSCLAHFFLRGSKIPDPFFFLLLRSSGCSRRCLQRVPAEMNLFLCFPWATRRKVENNLQALVPLSKMVAFPPTPSILIFLAPDREWVVHYALESVPT